VSVRQAKETMLELDWLLAQVLVLEAVEVHQQLVLTQHLPKVEMEELELHGLIQLLILAVEAVES
jgi:hypothetical protein